MKCPHCGRIIAENSKFCEFCGLPVEIKKTPRVNKKVGNKLKSTLGTIFIIVGLSAGASALWMYVKVNQDLNILNSETNYLDGYDSVLSERRLTEADLYGKSAWELKVMRNSVYARYGYIFHGGKLYQHFSQYDWYHPTEEDTNVVASKMSEVEKYNVGFILRYERYLGYK